MRISILAVCLLLIAPSAEAADGRFYFGAHGGLNLVQGARNDSAPGSFNFEFDPGFVAAATLGFDLREGHPSIGVGRVELEAAYRRNSLDEVAYLETDLPAGGNMTVSSLMLNTFGEHRGTRPWIPYIGAGIGVARLELKEVRFGENVLVDDSTTVFAWQVGAGLGLEVSRHIALDLGYRYFSAFDPKFRDARGVRFESEYDNHQIMAGVRIDF